MQPELAARIDQPIHHQQLQHPLPRYGLPLGGQPRIPKLVQPQLAPQLATQPAVAPDSRTMQLHLVELDLNAVDGVAGNLAVFGEQAQLGEPLLALDEDFQGFAPSGLLAVIDLAQVEHAALSHLAGAQAPGSRPR